MRRVIAKSRQGRNTVPTAEAVGTRSLEPISPVGAAQARPILNGCRNVSDDLLSATPAPPKSTSQNLLLQLRQQIERLNRFQVIKISIAQRVQHFAIERREQRLLFRRRFAVTQSPGREFLA